MQKEKAHILITSMVMVVEKPMKNKAVVRANIDTNMGILLSYFVISQPEKGNPIKEQMGNANKIVPNSASFKW